MGCSAAGLVAGTLLIQGGEVVIDDLEHDLVESG